jgi:hypothetical protein
MAQTTGFNLPPPQEPFVDPKTGILSFTGYQYLLSLLNAAATAQATSTVATGLQSTGVNQATALQLGAQWNEVEVVPAGPGVLLSAYDPGQSQTIFNEGVHALLIYPAPGSQIDALGQNEPFSLAAGVRVTFDFTTATQIRS